MFSEQASDTPKFDALKPVRRLPVGGLAKGALRDCPIFGDSH
jgi:hypothetical protein